jgi:hypothetical protein
VNVLDKQKLHVSANRGHHQAHPMSYRGSTYIICATAHHWWDLTSVTCWTGISGPTPSGGGGPCGWALRRMSGPMPLAVGGLSQVWVQRFHAESIIFHRFVARGGPSWVSEHVWQALWLCVCVSSYSAWKRCTHTCNSPPTAIGIGPSMRRSAQPHGPPPH